MFNTLLLCLSLIFIVFPVRAEEMKNNYIAEYFIPSPSRTTQADVHYSITLQNPTGKEASEQFLISIPSSFRATDIAGVVNEKTVAVQSSLEQNQLNIIVPLATDEDLKDKLNISLNFKQENILTQQGQVYELLIPTLLPSLKTESSVLVHLPAELRNSVILSKPMFSSRTSDTLSWNRVDGKTIQVAFGKGQNFAVKLRYQLENSSPLPSKATVAFPPDTIGQRVIFKSLTEAPENITVDHDGNVLAKYLLSPSQKKEIVYTADILLYQVANEEVATYQKKQFQSQKKYLLKPFSSGLDNAPKFSSINSVYSYVLATLSYDYSQLSNNSPRYRHKPISEILGSPSNSVCLDYSSLFISLARQNALYAREIIGYGFSPNEQIRPQSGDILHAWAEYYNLEKNQWFAVDPTWEDTSKIDYFSSLDLNHIALAIRGESSASPYPAGFFRFKTPSDTNLVSITYADSVPQIKKSIELKLKKGSAAITAGNSATYLFSVRNSGNVTQYNLPVSAEGEDLDIRLSSKVIDVIAPLQTVSITADLKPNRFTHNDGTEFKLVVGDNKYQHRLKILPAGYNIAFVSSFSVLSVLILILIVVKRFKNA